MSALANPAQEISRAQTEVEIQHRMPSLDGLRALAILLVIPHNIDFLQAPISLLLQPESVVMHAGWIGVQLFFVLSGFLITGNLLDTQKAQNYYTSFVARRALRIFPLYYGVLIATFVIVPALGFTPVRLQATSQHQIWLWTFLTNWFAPSGAVVFAFGHFWSLAIEEQFYLLWPVTIRRLTAQKVLKLCIVICVAALAIRAGMVVAGSRDEAIYMFTFSRMDALAGGAAAASVFRIPSMREHFVARLGTYVGLAIFALVAVAGMTRGYFADDDVNQILGFSVLAITFAILTLAAAVSSGKQSALVRILSSRALGLVGKYSFGMYVIHLPLHIFVTSVLFKRFAPNASNGLILVYILGVTLLSFLLAALSYELFERRFLELRRLFRPDIPATDRAT